MRYFIYLLIISHIMPPPASSAEYHIDKSQSNQVMFISDLPLGEFSVRTENIDGYVYWDGLSFPPNETHLKSSDIYFEVQLNSLDAGNSMYNSHLKENYLETEKYPYASFKGRIIMITPLTDSSYAINVFGDFSIHGKAKALEITGVVTPDEKAFRVECDFVVKISDYEIEIPKLMFIEADNDIKVNLVFYLQPSF